MTAARRIGIAGFLLWIAVAIAAPWIAPNPTDVQFKDRAYAPIMRVHVRDARGWHAPFVYRQQMANRLMRVYQDDVSAPLTLRWWSSGHLVSIDAIAAIDASDALAAQGPLLLLGGDAVGRDVFSRLVYGARLSIGVTVLGALGALLIGTLAGGLAGAIGGRVEMLVMLVADFVLVVPAVYLVLVLRAMLPLALRASDVFALMAVLFAVSAWPHVARGVRAIVATERARDYAEASRAAGATPWRVMTQLLPATRGFLGAECVLLIPALLAAESTISFLGLGFPEPSASWGTMLEDAANIRVIVEAPWMLAPAAALFAVVLCVQLIGGTRAPAHALLIDTAP